MIVGCGVDIIHTERFKKYATNEKFIQRFFHPDEITGIKINNKISAESLAARFAAKEALGKALGTGIGLLTLKDICVSKNAMGKPQLKVFNSVKEKIIESGTDVIHLSLSHDKDYAIAQVILEKTGGLYEH